MDLANFPFDAQRCKFSIESCKIVCFYINSVSVCLFAVCLFLLKQVIINRSEKSDRHRKGNLYTSRSEYDDFFFRLECPYLVCNTQNAEQ